MSHGFMELFTIFFAALIINNIILMRFIGLCSFFGVSERLEPSIGMSLAVTFVMMMATTVTWALYHWVLAPYNLIFLRCQRRAAALPHSPVAT